MKSTKTINRRAFLKSTTLAAGGLLVGFYVPAGTGKKRLPAGENMLVPNAFLRIGEDDSVTVILSRCEMGQGIWTGLCMLIAEELDADWEKIRAEHSPAAVIYYHTMYGTQRTGGSTSLSSEFDRYRKAGATARQMLVQAAASRLNVPVSECRTEKGYVIAGDKKIRYGELVSTAVTLAAPIDVTLKDPANWKIIGHKKIKRLDTPDKITGKAVFGIDVQFAGMLVSMIARPPVPGAKVKSFDEKAAMAIPGVKQVVQIPQGVAVLAEDTWAASQGRKALKVDWDTSVNASLSSAVLLADMKKRADAGGLVATNTGNLDEGFKKAVKVVEAEYFLPFLAHAPMEPLNCTVKLSNDKCEVWTGTQTQTDDQHAAAELTWLPLDKVFINTVMLGGSFGRRNITRSDFVREAVEVAKASGKLVKVVWTREDDIQGGFYRPAFLHRFKVGLDQNGIPIAWKQVSVGQSVMKGGPFESVAVINGIDMFSIEGMQTAAHIKAIPNQRIELNTPDYPILIDNWRAVGVSHTIFAMESLADEMARAAGKDPVAYRRMLYKAEPRLVKALDLAAEKSGWGQKLPAGKGRGVAVYEAVSSYAAIVVEVTAGRDGSVKIDKVTCAIDCGIAINPDGIIAQTEGSLAFGLSTALYSEITLKEGKVQQKNFYNYPILRMNEMPRIEVFVVPGAEKPTGVGEATVGQVMPALTNAIFAATGKRIRNLPIKHIA